MAASDEVDVVLNKATLTGKAAKPNRPSCQQGWTMLCCPQWTMLCCTQWTMMCYAQWTMMCCTQWTMLSTTLFGHDNNVVTALFDHQYCYNLLTRLSNIDNNNEQACSIYIVFSCFNNRCCFINAEQHCWNNNEQHCSLNNIVQPW